MTTAERVCAVHHGKHYAIDIEDVGKEDGRGTTVRLLFGQ